MKDFIINILVGGLAMATILAIYAGGEWLRANDLEWIVGIPLSLVLVSGGSYAIGFMIRTFITETFKKQN